MGYLMDDDTPYQQQQNYYGFGGFSDADLGSYQFVSLDSIITNFMFTHVGEHKIINKVSRTDVQFHGMRAIAELSYDVFRSVKSQEIEVPSTLKMPLPHDYVNYVKLVRVGGDGVERIIYPTGKTSNPFAIEQDATTGDYQFDISGPASTVMEQGDDLTGGLNEVTGELDQPDGVNETFYSDTWNSFSSQPLAEDYSDDADEMEIDNRGRRYGLDPQHAQLNGTFFIDYQRGYIHFSSTLAGKTVTLKYISDSLGTDDEMLVHKFCEEAVYKWIAYGVLSTRSNIPEYIIARFKKERFAETRKAKIRLSNIKIEEFTQVLKGMSKQIK